MITEIVFTFLTTYNAICGERALLDAGLAARVMPRPSALGQGCGICLRVDEADGKRAEAALASAGVAVEGVYMKFRDGRRMEYRKV